MHQIEFKNNIWSLKGNMTFKEIPILIEETNNHEWTNSVILDLTQVKNIDTSLLGVLFEWKRKAKIKHQTVSIKTPPENLIKLAKLYGVEDFI